VVSRSGNAGAAVDFGGAGSTVRGSVGSGARGCPFGEPTAATAGTRFTTYVFGLLVRQT
jgi:hypothetical protein